MVEGQFAGAVKPSFRHRYRHIPNVDNGSILQPEFLPSALPPQIPAQRQVLAGSVAHRRNRDTRPPGRPQHGVQGQGKKTAHSNESIAVCSPPELLTDDPGVAVFAHAALPLH